MPLHLLQDSELRLQGTAMYVREDVERALELVADGSVPAARLVSAEYSLEDAAEAFHAAGSGSGDAAVVKVHLLPQD